MGKYNEYKELHLSRIAADMLSFWKQEQVFEKSVSNREGKKPFTFYEGPPSANGTPGIHHVMARTVKDIFCRYKTLQGFQVKRKGGWDTHGLPVELQVEKLLGITKDDIGKKISIEDYNRKCRETVMMYKDQWDDLTEKMGYWVDLKNPYITYNNEYIESVWWILKQFYQKGLLYKGYTIQPYSPSDGTGLSSHELNQPGCYKNVKDTSVVAQFKLTQDSKFKELFNTDDDTYLLAWTTTPWTLPSNTSLVVGEKIKYVKINTFNPYTFNPVSVVLAKDLVGKYFSEKNKDLKLVDYKSGDKAIPFEITNEFSGKDLVGLHYEQLMPYLQPLYDADKAFRVVAGDFVTTEDGTGIVHSSPTFGADDFRVSKQNGIPPLTLKDENDNEVPTVDRKGKFVKEIGAKLKEGVARYRIKTHKPLGENDFYVKNYTDEDEANPDYKNTDVIISIILKEENKAFKVEKYEHTYPHSWRTDKPVLYYPLDAWFIKTTALKDRLVELNKTINWKPESTGTGRFGNWLENLVDWNLSRSRFWGTPLPIWRTKDGKEEICIGSVDELKVEIEKAKTAKISDFKLEISDLHRPYVDEVILVSKSGQPMYREPDLIDVWFDSGAMPYAQWGLDLSQTLSDGKGFETADPHSYKKIKEFCDEQRANPTEAEGIIWNFLKGNKLGGYHFRRQHIIDRYIADFVCISKTLIVEIDGLYHSHPDQTESDAQRTKRLNELGYKIIRFTNAEVISNPESVLDKILNECSSRQNDFSRAPFGKGWVSSPPWGEDGRGVAFPADFIAEGVDQTRGWFFTLHAIGGLLFDSVAFKNVISNGLVLDKDGNKMSKRKGNVVDPFAAMEKYGADVLRWYMIENAPPWDNLKFDFAGVEETQRKFFGTLQNTYSFFALYANIDGFVKDELNNVAYNKLTHLDRWIISKLQSLITEVTTAYEEYEPTRAARAIQEFVNDHLSNWYVRLNRKRFWQPNLRGEISESKKTAYETLYECLMVTAQLMSPIAPFYADWLYRNLSDNIRTQAIKHNTPLQFESVHLTNLVKAETNRSDHELELSMGYAQTICSLVHSIRKNSKIKVRTPLQRVLLPVLDEKFAQRIKSTEDIIKSEVNVKSIEYIDDTSGLLVKSVKPNLPKLGKQYGSKMKEVSAAISSLTKEEINQIEKKGVLLKGGFELTPEDVIISSQDIPGWAVANEGSITVALDITITPELKREGVARDFVNRVQNLRKDSGFEVLDKISIEVEKDGELAAASLNEYKEYICTETQALSLELKSKVDNATEVDMDEFVLKVKITKI
ncbi:MAG: isoleucine--tRNA ligase [Bacteroidetes bacterium]|nr:isoleucine--tRNA ligase [Bacteroidota bacterium]MBS1540878.1 isoleucine--tRNA ligase [Bacteroidota bacterium]